MGTQLMAVVSIIRGKQGKTYLAADDTPPELLPPDELINARIATLCQRSGLSAPDERIEINPRSMDVDRWGLTRFSDLFTSRQTLSLLA